MFGGLGLIYSVAAQDFFLVSFVTPALIVVKRVYQTQWYC